MQKALQEMIRNKLTSIQRIEVTNDRIGDQRRARPRCCSRTWRRSGCTMEEVDRDGFDTRRWTPSVNAKKIYILGRAAPRPLWPGSWAFI